MWLIGFPKPLSKTVEFVDSLELIQLENITNDEKADGVFGVELLPVWLCKKDLVKR